ncbi:MAG: hypothetical protein ACR2NP_05570, partial [Pirellulaceae bacterium]
MRFKQVSLVTAFLLAGWAVASQIQQRTPERPVTRAQRPVFEQKDWDSIFFEDIFAEGLSGERPGFESGPVTEAVVDVGTPSSGGWAGIIDAAELENEVKRLQVEVSTQITTPVRFKTSHTQISDTFSQLAMLFAVIGQYEDQVRWQDAAVAARYAFSDASAKTRKDDMAAFNAAKQRSETLTEMVRGGKFPDEPEAGDSTAVEDWSAVIDRSIIMERLEVSVSELLKEPTSSEDALKADGDVVIHEADMIALMGRVLQQPGMYDADDDDYN